MFTWQRVVREEGEGQFRNPSHLTEILGLSDYIINKMRNKFHATVYLESSV